MARKELFDCHDKLLKLSSAIAETKTKTVRKKKRFFCVYNHRRFSDLPYRVIFFFFFTGVKFISQSHFLGKVIVFCQKEKHNDICSHDLKKNIGTI